MSHLECYKRMRRLSSTEGCSNVERERGRQRDAATLGFVIEGNIGMRFLKL